MTVADSLAKTTAALPLEKQQQVLDFAEFLSQRSIEPGAVTAPTTEEVKKALAASAGIWQDRADLPGGSAQAAQVLRDRASQRSSA